MATSLRVHNYDHKQYLSLLANMPQMNASTTAVNNNDLQEFLYRHLQVYPRHLRSEARAYFDKGSLQPSMVSHAQSSVEGAAASEKKRLRTTTEGHKSSKRQLHATVQDHLANQKNECGGKKETKRKRCDADDSTNYNGDNSNQERKEDNHHEAAVGLKLIIDLKELRIIRDSCMGIVNPNLCINQHLKTLEDSGQHALTLFGANNASIKEAKELLNAHGALLRQLPVGVPTCLECTKDCFNMYNVGTLICKCLREKYTQLDLGQTITLSHQLWAFCLGDMGSRFEEMCHCRQLVEQLQWHLESLQFEVNKFFRNFTMKTAHFMAAFRTFAAYKVMLEKWLCEKIWETYQQSLNS